MSALEILVRYCLPFGLALEVVACGAVEKGPPKEQAPDAGQMSPGSDAAPSCTPGTEDIYAVSSDLDLYRFHPASLSAVRVGPISCGPVAANATVHVDSMTIDKTGTAWLSVSTITPPMPGSAGTEVDALWKIRTADATCLGTLPTSAPVALTFYADAQHPNDEELLGNVQGRLVHVDEATGSFTSIGMLGGAAGFEAGHLTSSRDGRLYTVELPNPWQSEGSNTLELVRLDPATGASVYSTPFTVSDALPTGVVFWGGVFWSFAEPSYSTSTGPNPTPGVGRIDPSTDTYSVVVPDLGFEPAGAGGSTCAPIAP